MLAHDEAGDAELTLYGSVRCNETVDYLLPDPLRGIADAGLSFDITSYCER